MQGLILAAGSRDSQGRDRSQSPRGLTNLADKPVIDYIVEGLLEAGCHKILISSSESHRDAYRQYFDGFSSAVIEVLTFPEISTMHSLSMGLASLGSAEGAFAVTDDEVFDFSLSPMVEEQNRTKRGVIAVRNADCIDYSSGEFSDLNLGICKLDHSGQVTSISSAHYRETAISSDLVLLGMTYFEGRNLKRLIGLDLNRSGLELNIEFQKDLQGLIMNGGFWADIGKPPMYQAAEDHFSRSVAK